jgi:cation:H+ antiporter
MTPAAAIPVFLVSVGAMLAAASVFAGRLDHIGLRLGLPETLLGLLTALAADAPELASTVTALVEHKHSVAVGVAVGASAFNIAAMLGLSVVVTARIHARHEVLELEAFVGLWMIAVVVLVAAGVLGGVVGAVLAAVVAVPYVALLAGGRRFLSRLRLGAEQFRFVERSFGEEHVRPQPLDYGREAAQIVLVLVAALGLIVAGSIGAVQAATSLADRWSVPETLVGAIVLAVLTALPNAWTGIRFGLQQRGSALMSETLNSNSINVAAGIALPAALGALVSFSRLDVFDLAWLFGMTTAALVLFGRPRGAGRSAGALLIVLYAVFVAVQITASG